MQRNPNDTFLRNIKPPERGRIELRDTWVRGLVLRLTATGAATWSMGALNRAFKHTRVNLGTYPALPVAEARKAALAEATVAERLAQWQAAKTSRWSDRYAGEVARLVAKEIVPAIGAKPLRMTTREDWTRLIAQKRASAPVVAGYLYRLASSFLNHAEAEGWIDAPILPRKGATRLAPPPPPRVRALSDDKLIAVWNASATEPPKPRAFVRLLILTGCCCAKAAAIAAGEVDRAAGLWRLPAERVKSGRAHVMPLCDLVPHPVLWTRGCTMRRA
jgi:integrase